MAGGALIGVVAYGNQDFYLTGDPTITYFKSTFRRHTHAQIEAIENTIQGSADFGKRISVVISRNGDLVHRMWLEIQLPGLTAPSGTTRVAWTRQVGSVLVKEVELSIGGSRIDKHYSEWFMAYHELYTPASKESGLSAMLGNTAALTTPAASIASRTIMVPLLFFFNRHPGLALPLIALQFHDVKLDITFRDVSECYTVFDDSVTPPVPTATQLASAPTLGPVSVWADYVFLDLEERNTFASEAHEYVIEQVQFNGAESFSSSSVKSRLSFNHPVKELVFSVRLDQNSDVGANRWSDMTLSGGSAVDFYKGAQPLTSAVLQLNGNDRFAARRAEYFNLVQPYQHHTRVPATGWYVYSFALFPESAQPSGTLNFSRIDTAVLSLNTATGSSPYKLYVFALSYNILRIKSGMGGLAFSS